VGGVGVGTVVLAAAAGFVWVCGLPGFSTRASGRARRCWVGSSRPCSPPSWPGWVGLVVAGGRIPCGAGGCADRGGPRDRRLPDRLVLPSYPISIVFLGVAAGATHDWADAARAAAGMVVLLAGYGMLVLARWAAAM